MPDLRYMGKHHWTQTVLDDDGKFKKFENIAPGEVFSVDEQVAERFLQGPRDARLFVAAGSSEDPASDDYQPSKWDRDIFTAATGQYVSEDHLREFGSTTPEGRAIFRTEDDNPEALPVAPPDAGPQSDNERLYEAEEIQNEADKAKEKAAEKARESRESRSAKRSDSSSRDSDSRTTDSDSSHRSSGDRPQPRAQGQS